MSMDILRNKKYTRYVYYTVAIAFVVSLGAAGIGGGCFRQDPDTVALVNGKAIKREEFERVVKRTLDQYQERFFKGEDVPVLPFPLPPYPFPN